MAGEAKKEGFEHNRVGPIFRTGELADAAIEALEEDNPGKEFEVSDHTAYIRVETDDECIIKRETMEEILGRSFDMQELETVLSSFSGQIDADQNYVRFYFTKRI